MASNILATSHSTVLPPVVLSRLHNGAQSFHGSRRLRRLSISCRAPEMEENYPRKIAYHVIDTSCKINQLLNQTGAISFPFPLHISWSSMQTASYHCNQTQNLFAAFTLPYARLPQVLTAIVPWSRWQSWIRWTLFSNPLIEETHHNHQLITLFTVFHFVINCLLLIPLLIYCTMVRTFFNSPCHNLKITDPLIWTCFILPLQSICNLLRRILSSQFCDLNIPSWTPQSTSLPHPTM